VYPSAYPAQIPTQEHEYLGIYPTKIPTQPSGWVYTHTQIPTQLQGYFDAPKLAINRSFCTYLPWVHNPDYETIEDTITHTLFMSAMVLIDFLMPPTITLDNVEL